MKVLLSTKNIPSLLTPTVHLKYQHHAHYFIKFFQPTNFSSHPKNLAWKLTSPILVDDVGSVLQKVNLARLVLGVARVELDNVLEGAVLGGADVEGLGDDVEGDTLVARGGGEGASITVDVGAGEVAAEGREVEGTGVSLVAGVGDGADTGKDSVENVREGLGVGSSNLDEETDDGQGVVYRDIVSTAVYLESGSYVESVCLPAAWKTK